MAGGRTTEAVAQAHQLSLTSLRTLCGRLWGQREEREPGSPAAMPPPPIAHARHLLSQNRIFWSLWPLMMTWSPHTTSLQ